MVATVRTETRRGAYAAVYPDGRRVEMEREVIITTDIRDTPLGPVDFGHVLLLPWRYIVTGTS